MQTRGSLVMKITLLTYGSRGDVQPFLALARGLQEAGHEVKLAAPQRFEAFIRSFGVPCVPLAGDPEVISRGLNNAGTNPVAMVRSISNYVFKISPQVSRAAFTACEGADLLVHSFLFTVGAHSWAFERGIPDVSVQTFPMFAPTRAFPNVAFPAIPPGWMSYFSHWFASQVFWHGGNLGYGPARRANPDIPFPSRLYWPFKEAVRRPRTPLLFAYSPGVLPRPREWGASVHVTGYFYLGLQDTFQPPDALTAFLAEGGPPVCVTFGSMIHRDVERIYRSVLEAVGALGERAILLGGWSDLPALGAVKNILVMDAAPHEWLLPRCRAVIHHGGAGTTAAGLRAGIPNVVVPFAADQPFWGARVHALGAGPAPIPVRKLSVERLVAALSESSSGRLRSGAEAIGRVIREEAGVDAAVRLIQARAAAA